MQRHRFSTKAPIYNPKEFRPGFTLVTIEAGVMKLTYKSLDAGGTVSRDCKLAEGVQ